MIKSITMRARITPFLLLATAAFAQPAHVSIEVASIRPSDSTSCKDYPIIDDHNDRYDLKCVKPKFLIQVAYNVRDFQVLRGPDWLSSAQYDIAAKTESSPVVSRDREKDVAELSDSERRIRGERLRAMLQSLLAERFQLKVHTETKELPALILKVAKGGPKLKAEPPSEISGGLRLGSGSLAGTQTDIPFLAQTLSQILARPVVDQTGLAGKYDFELQWTPDQSSPNGPLGEPLPSASTDPNHPNIFTALQEQLGLKLDSSKTRVDVISVDQIQRPSPN
jgi:bla regulator protein blaR1